MDYFDFLMGYTFEVISENCDLDFPEVKKHIWLCKVSATTPEQSRHQVSLDVTLKDEIPHGDNQQLTLREKCLNMELFLVRMFLYSD